MNFQLAENTQMAYTLQLNK